MAEATKKLRAAFPTLPDSWYNLFYERVKALQFNSERLLASVNHVIDTCPYPVPTLANFLSFDKKVKLYTYAECGGRAEYVRVVVGEGIWFALREDALKYKLTIHPKWRQK